jgi:predicted AAA+ superfamily ATPase
MDKEFVISYLKTRNYWWQTGEVSPADNGIVRHEYLDEIREIEKLERIICLSGIRRSGKTTIRFQYIDHLLRDADAEPQKIVYAKVDDLQGKIDSVHDILNIYHELTGINPAEENVYLFLDEIHVWKGWQLQLKYYLDAHAKCRFIVSGSSKTLLYKDASESLAGRIRFIDVFPLTFREFVEFNGITLPAETMHVSIDDLSK